MRDTKNFRVRESDRAENLAAPGGNFGNGGNAAWAGKSAGNEVANSAGRTAGHRAGNAENLRVRAAGGGGEYDALRLRSQRDIIRDVMISASDCGTWLTLGELRGLTRFGEASISAQLRHLRRMENGGYDVVKRHRAGAWPERRGWDGRGECVWEYRIARGNCGGATATVERSAVEVGTGG